MNRSYSVGRFVRVVPTSESATVANALDYAFEQRLPGLQINFTVEHDRVVLPYPHEIWTDGGRTLRDDELEPVDAEIRRILRDLSCTEWSHIGEMYLLDWSAFTPALYDRLSDICAALPGALLEGMAWFSTDPREPHIFASREPPGLQIEGVLTTELFNDWHEAFLAATRDLPFRSFSRQ